MQAEPIDLISAAPGKRLASLAGTARTGQAAGRLMNSAGVMLMLMLLLMLAVTPVSREFHRLCG